MSQDPVDPLLPSTLIKDLLPKLARVMEIGKGEMDSRQGSQLIFEAVSAYSIPDSEGGDPHVWNRRTISEPLWLKQES